MSPYRHLLHHVEDLLGPVQPHVVVGDGHGLEGDLLRVLEVGIRPPDAVEPLNGQQLEVITVTKLVLHTIHQFHNHGHP